MSGFQEHSFRKRVNRCVGFALFALAGVAYAQTDRADDPAAMILKRADEVRFPATGFQVDVAIRSSGVAGDDDERRELRVLSQGNANSIVMTTAPASERGQIMLMKGRDLWLFLPAVSQPVRLSLAQRLTGQVANGDIARANFTGDYNPKLLRREQIDNDFYHVLELNAVDRAVTYQRVLYWVRENDYRPYKAEFYSTSQRLLKTCYYENYKMLGGQLRPTRLVMRDALKADEQSLMEYSNLKSRDLPDKVFTKEYLKKLE